VFVEGKYPKQAPTVVCRNYEWGEVTDGRDLLSSVLNRQWNDKDSIGNILSSLCDFAVLPKQKSLETLVAQGGSLAAFGCFHLAYPMHFDIWGKHPHSQVFECTEVDHRGFRSPRERRLVLTPAQVLVLEPSARFPGIGHLLLHAPYSALSSVRWLNFNKELLSFYWKQGSEAVGQQLHFTDPAAVIDALFAKARACGLEGVKITAPEGLSEEEVKSAPKLDIDRMLMEIEATESEVVKTPTLEAVNGLLATFQRVIEYYSALGDSKYDLYLKRMHEMLHNEGIQRLLGYSDDSKAAPILSDSTEDAPLLPSPESFPPVSPPTSPPLDSAEEAVPLFSIEPTSMSNPPDL